MSFKRWSRRTVHPLRRWSHRQDAVITLYFQHALIRLKFDLRLGAMYTSEGKVATSSWRHPVTYRAINTNG